MALVNTFDFNNETLTVYGTVDEPWFKARDIANMLEYTDTKQAIRDHVLEVDIKTWRELSDLQGGVEKTPPSNMQPLTKFINESGVNSLIMGSKKKAARKFKHWITSEVLPSLRKTGKYEMKTVQHNNDAIELEYLKMYRELADDRDKIIIRDYLRNKYTHHKQIENGNNEQSISYRLQEFFNIKDKNRLNRVQELGKIFKQKYMQLHGKEPLRRDQYTGGTIRKVFHYTEKDYDEFGDDLIVKFFKLNI